MSNRFCGDVLKDPAKRAEWVYGQPMKPCPRCYSYNMKWQTPIRMESIGDGDAAADIVQKWARATRDGLTPLEGPVYLHCADCLHRGPALDCSGMTREEVGRDRHVAAEVKRLWNSQAPYCHRGGV